MFVKIKQFSLISSFLIFCFVGTAGAATYYVSASSSNTNWSSCTNSGTPCTPRAAMSNAQAGDVVNFLAGTYNLPCNTNYYEDNSLQPAHSGTSVNPIVFQANPGDTVTLVGAAGHGVSCDDGGVIGVNGAYGKSYITIKGLIIDVSGYPSSNVRGGMQIRNTVDHITIQDIEIKGFTSSVSDNHPGIYCNGTSYVTIQNCKIHGFHTPFTGEAILQYSSDHLLVQNCELYDNGEGVTDKQQASHNTYRYNYIHGNSVNGIEIMTQGGNSDGIDVYQNIFTGTGINLDSSIDHSLKMQNVHVYNNVFYNAGDINFFQTNNLAEAWNNIVYRSGSRMMHCDLYGPSYCNGISYSDYNDFYSSDNSGQTFVQNGSTYNLTTWRASVGHDLSSITGNPLFVNPSGDVTGFKLQNGSAALSAGMDRGDYNNNGNTSEKINMGAYITGNETIGTYITGSGNKVPAAPMLQSLN